MIPRSIKLRWAKKLLRAKYFVVLTDKESVIAFAGVDPENFTDILALTSQAAEVEMFYEALGELTKDHKKAIERLENASKDTRKQTSKRKSARA
jgi:hypothetical protein